MKFNCTIHIVSILLYFGCLNVSQLPGQTPGPYFASDSLVIHRAVHQAYLEYLTVKNEAQDNLLSPDNYLREKYLETIIAFSGKDFFDPLQTVIDSALQNQQISNELKIIYISNFTEAIKNIAIPLKTKLKYFQAAIDLCEPSTSKNYYYLMHLLHNRGVLYNSSQRYLEAEKDLKSAIDMAKLIDDPNSSMLGILYYNLGDLYINAESNNLLGYKFTELAEEELSNSTDPNVDYLSQAYNRLSDAAAAYGDLEKARNYVIKSYNFRKSRSKLSDRDIMHAYYKLIQFQDTNTIEQAIQTMHDAEQEFTGIRPSAFTNIRMAAIYNVMGELLVKKQPLESLNYYYKALQIVDESQPTYYLQFTFNVGKANLYAGRYTHAIRIAEQLIQAGIKRADNRLPYFYFLRANALLYQGELEDALESIDTVVNLINQSDIRINIEDHDNLSSYYSDKGFHFVPLFIRIGDELLKTHPNHIAAKTQANAIYQIGLIHYKNNYPNNHLNQKSFEYYQGILSGILRTRDFMLESDLTTSQLITFSEHAKARYLWQNFKLNNRQREQWDESLLIQEQKLRSELTDLKNMRLQQPDSILEQRLFDIQLELERIEKEKRNVNTSFYAFEEYTFDFEKFQRSIPSEVIYLKYELLDTILYLFTIRKDSVDLMRLNRSADQLDTLKQFIELVSMPQSSLTSVNAMSKRMGSFLLPVIPGDVEKLVIAGDGLLHHLPFDIIKREDQYLIESYTIANTVSLAIQNSSQIPQKIQSALVVAPSYEETQAPGELLAIRGGAFDLEGALYEAEKISEILPANLLWKKDALKSTFVQNAQKYDLLHLAMHSFLNDNDPELSHLAFYDGTTHDHQLHISELYGLPLNAKMAVLSACNTGIGEEHIGEGVTSLNRAFTYAGVPSVVSSLWSAPDQTTSELMIHFYENLHKGMAKDQALRKAKQTFLANQTINAFHHPYYWAAFVIHGDTTPIIIKQKMSYSWILILGISLVIFILIFILRETIL